jgi:hypothetical protein
MTITSDQNPHATRQASGGHGWEVSRLAGQALDRGTAMLLADTAGARDLPEGHRVWPRIPGWAGEPGLTAPGAITRAPEAPEKTSNQEDATSRADPRSRTMTAPHLRPERVPEPPDPGSGVPGHPAPDVTRQGHGTSGSP